MSTTAKFAVFTEAKNLYEYLGLILTDAPIEYRHTLVRDILQGCVEVIDLLCEANAGMDEEWRLKLQNKAIGKLQRVSMLVNTAFTTKTKTKKPIIAYKQNEHISKMLLKLNTILYGWRNSNAVHKDQLKKRKDKSG